MPVETKLPFKIFQFIVRPFIGTGIGRFRPLGALYRYLARNLIVPEGERMVSVNNYRMYVHLDDNRGTDGIAQELIYSHNYEASTSNLFKKFVKPGSTVVDIGANIGYFSLLAATLAGENGKVYAFEPEPKNYQLLVQNIELNSYKNIAPVQKAVSNKIGTLEFFVDEKESGGHSIYQDAVQEGNGELSHRIQIEAVSLDEFFGDSEVAVDLIKMDIQGAEPLALEGMKKTVVRSHGVKMIIEFWPYGLEKVGFPAKQCWDLLTGLGFKYKYRIHDRSDKLDLADLENIVKHCHGGGLKPPTAVNLLCCKEPI